MLFYMDVQITELILLPAFVFGALENTWDFYGIASMSFQVELTASASRVEQPP